MASSLYNEALNDARAIREAAEERAKQQLLESMSPKLKKIVENTINEEMGLTDQFDEDDDCYEGQMGNASQKTKMGEVQSINLDEDDEDVDECGSSMYAEGDSDVDECGSSMYEDDEEVPSKSKKTNEAAQKVLKLLLNKDVLKRNLQTEVANFENDVKALKKMFTIIETNKVKSTTMQKVDKTLIKLVENSKNIASNNIIKNQTEIKQTFSNALQELNQMTRRRNNILAENYASLSRRSRRLFEADGEEEEQDPMAGMGDEEGGDEGMDMDMGDMDMGGDDEAMGGGSLSDADSSQLRDIADKIEAMIGGGAGGGAGEDMDLDMEMGGEEGEEGEEEASDDEEETKSEWARRRGRVFYESDDMDEESFEEGEEYSDSDEKDMTEAYFYEADDKADKLKKKKEAEKKKKEKEEKMKEAQRRRGDVFLEIDENMLRREIARMKRLREGDAVAMASHFGGGKAGDEMFVDFDSDDLNGEANNLGGFHKGGSTIKEGRSYNGNSQTRLLEGKVQNYQRALNGMKNQLSEMNLFNAKLLYANKLMQNRELSASQQRHIVESLDQAKTLREAKLLFEGLSKSLLKSSGRSGSLNESATRRIAGGSSRSTSSAQALNNRVETDRWALLAGIKK